MAPQFIITMRDLRRVHPPGKEVLRGINISMYPGAKIGVLGLNGSGKSTLLRIMAGEDDGYQGECRLTPGFSVGFLPQEPALDPAKDVLGNVTDGVAATKALLDRFNAVCEAMGDPDADFDKLLAEQAELQDRIDATNAWDVERQVEIAMDALRVPDGAPLVAHAALALGGFRIRCEVVVLELHGGLLLLGRRLRRGAEGSALGVALAYGLATFAWPQARSTLSDVQATFFVFAAFAVYMIFGTAVFVRSERNR